MEKPGSSSIELNGEKDAVEDDQGDLSEEVEVASQMQQFSVQGNRNMDGGNQVIRGAAAVFGGGGADLGVFPEELWMNILDELQDPRDIQNVFRAFPALDKAFQNQKASWLFGLVLPHLMSKHLVQEASGLRLVWIHSKELLKLRRVSKRWKNAVENALENHADRHPLLPRRGTTAELEPSVVAIPEHHFNYQRMWDSRLGPSMFHEAKDINNFLGEMGGYRRGNPFPGKSVFLQICQNSDFRQVVLETVTMLERFGENVLDLEIEYWVPCVAVGDMELCRNILKCLALVPNLRSLIFSGHLFCLSDPETNKYFGTPESQAMFPELANLVRFEWRVGFIGESNWITRMVDTYGKKVGLRRLGIPINLLWTMELTTNHPTFNLTELCIFLDVDFDGNVERIGNLMNALPNHQEIRKFGLTSLVVPFSKGVDYNELIRMLAEFQFESVILQDIEVEVKEVKVEEVYSVSPPLFTVPAVSVTSLVLEDKGDRLLNFDFLRMLPSLKVLSVYVGNYIRTEALERFRIDVYKEGVDTLGQMLRRYFLKAYDPTLEIPESGCIWNEIPSLEMLNVSMQVSRREANMVGVQFVREYGNKAFFGPRPDLVEWDDD